MTAEPTRVLLVDNETSAREWLAEWLRHREGAESQQIFEVQTASDGTQCLEKVSDADGNYDVIVMDLFLGSGPNGVETMKEVKKRYPVIETIIITGFGDVNHGMKAVKAGAYRYVTKPFDNDDLVVYIERAAEKRKLLSEISRAKIYETFTALRRGLELDQILDGIVENLQGLFKLTTCTIALLDPKKTQIQIVAERGLNRKFSKSLSDFPKDFRRVIEQERVLEIIDLEERPDWKAALVRPDLKSLTLLPLKSMVGSLGALTMGRLYRTNPSSDEEIRLLMGLADQAAIAIENARLHEQTRKRAALLGALDDAALDLVNPVGIAEVMLKTIKAGCKLLQASGGAVYLFIPPDEKKLIVKASYGEPHIEPGIIIDRNKGVVGEVIKRKKPFSKADYSSWANRQEIFDHLGLQAAMGVPISYDGKLLGVIALHHKEPAKVFTEDQEESFARFGRHAGAALGKAQVLYETQKSGELMEALILGLSELGDERLIEKILILLRSHWPQGFCEILLRKPDTNELYVSATDFPVKEIRKTPIKIGKKNGIVGWVAHTGLPKVVFGVHEEDNYKEVLKQTQSEIAIPLVCDKKVLGVINIESPEIGAFNERDERVLTRLARAIAVRLNQSHQIEEARLQMEQSRSMASFTGEIMAAKTLQQKLNVLAKKILSVSQGDFCLVLLPTRDGHNLRVRAAEIVEDRISWGEVLQKLCRLLEIPQMPEVLLGSHTLFTSDDPLGEKIIAEITKHTELEQTLKTVLLIPLKGGATFAGLCIVGVVAGRHGEVFTKQEIGSTVTIADNAGPLIYDARLMELEQHRNQVFRDLMAVSDLVTSTLEKHKVFDLIVGYCRTLLKAEVATIFLVGRAGFMTLESNSGSPSGAANVGLKLPIYSGKVPVKCGLTGYLMAKGEIFNECGNNLRSHPAIKSLAPHPHLPSGYCESLLTVPLKKTVAGKDEVIGLIKLENKLDQANRVAKTHGFTIEDELVASTLASFAVTAIQNADHFAFATALECVAREVNSSIVNYGGVLERVLAELQQLVPFTSASIQLLEGNSLIVKACHGFSEAQKKEVLKLTFALIPRFPNEQVMRTKKSYRIDDIKSTRFEHFWKEKMYCCEHVRSWFGVPLKRGDKVIGMLALESDQPSFYTSADEDHAEAFANQVVPAIINAEKYKGAESLIEITRELNKQVDRSLLLQKIVNSAVNKNSIIGADKAIIYDYDAELDSFKSPAFHAGGLLNPELSNPPFAKTSVVYRCTELTEPHLAPRIKSSDVLCGNFTRREKIVSAAVFPLRVDEELVGLMFINYLDQHDFTDQEEEVMKLFALQAAIAIQNARRYEKLKQRMENAAAVARIGRFASTWAHDVHPSAVTIQVDVDALRQRTNDAESRQILDDIDSSASQIVHTVPNNLPTNHDPEDVDLTFVVEQILQRREQELNEAKVSIHTILDDVPMVRFNHQWMDWILERMINNALRFIKGGGSITLAAKVVRKRVLLDVIDSGPGVSEDLRDQLYTGKVVDPNSKGRGWSLMIAKSALNDFGGDILDPYIDQRGNVFTIDLPLASDPEVKNSDAEANHPHR